MKEYPLKRINLLSGPRNVSTALMYSFAQRSDTRVVDEPFYAWYLDQTGAGHPGAEEVLKAQPVDYQEVLETVVLAGYDRPILFIKNMAHHHTGMEWDYLEQTQNVFLIREPGEMITSFVKKIPGPTLRDTAYETQSEIFDYLKNRGHTPVVLDSAELLKNPRLVLSRLCKALEIPFEEKMLDWELGPLPEDGVWATYWYKNVHASTGFRPYRPKNEPVPERLNGLMKTCDKYYQKLFIHAIKAV